MNFNKQWIYDNNKVIAPVLAIILSTLATLLAIYTVAEFIFVLVPAVTFFTFHYTKLYKMKLRLLGGLIVFIVVVFITAGLATNIIYHAEPTYQTQFYNSNGNQTGTVVLASVSPFAGTSSSYNFQIYIKPNGTFDYKSVSLNIQELGGKTTVVHYSQMANTTYPGNNTIRLTYTTSLANGIYQYNLTAQSNGSLHTPSINGPFNTSPFSYYTYVLPVYAIYYTILYEMVFLAGVFIARSLSRSRRYNPPQPPQAGDQKNN